ncbi:DUF1707 domain-containing protein [Nonomuraea sp. B12E4]|uniref:DUF1707 SHOCT-like domain-containing protein n=1 Tax=Nonomuraea sp. B12E4 TaxID=3153564 RepID=UPI00325EB5C8
MTGVATAARSGDSEEAHVDRDDLRIGDAEREQTMAALREHFAQGRLTHEELDERLDQTLAAKTARDLAKVTADLPGSGPAPTAAPERPGHIPHYDRDAWRQAMKAHREQLQSMRHARRDMRRGWAGHPGPQGHHGHPWRHHRGPGPLLPLLFVFIMLGMVFGAGLFKVLIVVWLGALIFTAVHRRFHYRG